MLWDSKPALLIKEIDHTLASFVRGQITVVSILAVLYAIGLSIVGIPYAVAIGVATGLLNLVPYLGVAVGLVPAMLFALPYSSIWAPLGVIGVFVLGQTIEGLYLTPKIIGRNVGLSPVFVILSIVNVNVPDGLVAQLE